MQDHEHVTSGRSTVAACRLGVRSAVALSAIGVLYAAVIVAWLVVEATPAEPIGDPWLAAMEILTILSAVALLGALTAVHGVAPLGLRGRARLALAVGGLAALVTVGVHLVQLTAVRVLWSRGRIPDYRLVWPSWIFAVEYVAWDFLVGLALVLAAGALPRAPSAGAARRAVRFAGILCLVGGLGPLTGAMALQHVALAGYGLVLPVAAALLALFFCRSASADDRS